jgi:Ala-tRNA(Pro) deacylase
VKAGHDLAFRAPPGGDWLELPRGGFIQSRDIRIATPSSFRGEHSPAPIVAFVRRPVGSFGRYDRVPVLALDRDRVLAAGGWLPRGAVRLAFAHPRPSAIPVDGKWVHIDLGQQTLTAYEGDRLVFATLVSTGKRGDETRTGLFRVYHKTIHASMHGTDPADPYFVDEVPFVQYFVANMALHGTFWHDRFGERHSHGCVNLSFADAEWLFEWAPPRLPAGWHAVVGDQNGLWVKVEEGGGLPTRVAMASHLLTRRREEAAMPGRKLKDYLDSRRVPYEVIVHPPAYTAQEIAQRIHVHGWEFAKPVLLRVNGHLLMIVVPAPLQADLGKIRRLCAAGEVELVAEHELAELFPGNERGAMPPFGNLYGMPVLVDRRLAECERIVFNAGSHAEAIRMAFADYRRLVEPTIAEIGLAPEHIEAVL